MAVTYREARMIAECLKGTEIGVAARLVGLPRWMQRRPGEAFKGEVLDKLAELQKHLVEHALEVGLVDAIELHEDLSEQCRADIADLYNDANELKPISEWPAWARNGGVEIIDAPNMVPSKDGDSASWDQVGRKQTVKIAPRHKTWELAMKHKGVDAMVQQQKSDIHIHVEQERVREKLASARKRHAKVIEAQSVVVEAEKGIAGELESGQVVDIKED